MPEVLRQADWREVVLGDCVELITGFPFKSKRYTESSEDVRLLRGDNIGQGFLRWDGVKRWPHQEISNYEQYNLVAGDVVLAMDRPWIEAGLKWGVVGHQDLPLLLVQRVARLRGTNGLVTGFLRYVIGSPGFTDYVKSITTGVNVPHISGPDIKKYRLRLPPLRDQRRIASILSGYDDLIENNNRRIELLEEVARRVFDEWFVKAIGKLPLPGDDLKKLRLPKGWEIRALSALSKITMGQSPPSSQYSEDGGGLPFHQGVTDFDGFFHVNRLFCQAVDRPRIAESGDILFSVRAPVARLGLALDRLVIGRGLASVRPIPSASWYVWLHLRSMFPKPDMFGGGTIYKAVSKEDVHRIPIVWPTNEMVANFQKQAGPIWTLIRSLYLSSRQLKQSRDLLLPRLVSGEIEVAAGETADEPQAA